VLSVRSGHPTCVLQPSQSHARATPLPPPLNPIPAIHAGSHHSCGRPRAALLTRQVRQPRVRQVRVLGAARHFAQPGDEIHARAAARRAPHRKLHLRVRGGRCRGYLCPARVR
jgi:hypothetical protein